MELRWNRSNPSVIIQVECLMMRLTAAPMRSDVRHCAQILVFGYPLSVLGLMLIWLIFGQSGLSYAPALFFLPLLIAMSLPLMRQNARKIRPERILNNAPEVIGSMGVSILQYGSLDLALRTASKEGDSYIVSLFQDILWKVDSRQSSDVKTALLEGIRGLQGVLSPLRRSLNLLMAACEVEENERERMVDDANQSVITSLKELGESYCASLNVPAMVIFSIVVMVPVICMSLLPLLSMSGDQTSQFLRTIIPFVILLMVPLGASLYLLSLIRSNPFRADKERLGEVREFRWMLISLPLSILGALLLEEVTTILFVAIVPACVLTYFMMGKESKTIRDNEKMQESLTESLLEVGNRMLSGNSLHVALQESLQGREGTEQVWRQILNDLQLCREDESRTIYRNLHPYSPSLASTFVTISDSATKDPHNAGRLCLNLGRMMQDQAAVRRNIKNQLRSMMDMMNGTSALFAPLILGISSAMMLPLLGGNGGDWSLTLILGLYLVELCLISSFMTTYLMGIGGAGCALRRFTACLPVAISVFLLTVGLGG